MKKIEIKTIKIENFKGVKSKEITFSKKTVISGGNGVGKSTIMNAYLWCLFGQTSGSKTSTVQPVDSAGNTIHKIVTSVTVLLDIDGCQTEVGRTLKEKWSVPRGTNQEVLKGAETTFYWNGVPLMMSEFNDKINLICPSEDWALMTNITLFNKLNQNDKRAKLFSIAGDLDYSVLSKGLPLVSKALSQGKTIDEFKREVMARRKKAKSDLDEIPSRIDQQEKLRAELDFDKLRETGEKIKSKIGELEAAAQGRVDDQTRKKFDAINVELAAIERQKIDVRKRVSERFYGSQRDARLAYDTANKDLEIKVIKMSAMQENIKNSTEEISNCEGMIKKLREEWIKKNGEKFNGTTADACPLCGRPFSEEEKQAKLAGMEERFNELKNKALKGIEADAAGYKCDLEKAKEYIASQRLLEEDLQSTIEKEKSDVNNLWSQYNEALGKESFEYVLYHDEDYSQLTEKIKALQNASDELSEARQDKAEDEYRIVSLRAELSKVNTDIAKEETNKRIDELKANLERQSAALAQELTDMDAAIDQISAYGKRKIELVESSVSSLFSIVKWRFYDRNVTNDGEKEICEALVNGVSFTTDDLNDGASINAGVDICIGFQRAKQVSLPIFIDRYESVESLVDAEQQEILMQVDKGRPLEIRTL